MGDAKSITERGPQIFAGAGVLLLLLAAYVAGGDALDCARHGANVDCEVTRTRFLGHMTAERVTASDVVDVRVRTSYAQNGPVESPDSPYAGRTTTNHMVAAKTRAGQEVDLVGGDRSGQVADDLVALLKNPGGAPVTFYDSFNVIAGAIAGFGLVFTAFGAMAMRRA
ncbi:MAG TPA: hypothetical protein VLT86_14010 [Vicinamibacterales bacterium]|nr:hypothetical protein [Vicinamibacterales bacterium]